MTFQTFIEGKLYRVKPKNNGYVAPYTFFKVTKRALEASEERPFDFSEHGMSDGSYRAVGPSDILLHVKTVPLARYEFLVPIFLYSDSDKLWIPHYRLIEHALIEQATMD
jgi:hypothetical protein